ncbi:hypothetical protein Bhyg_05078 [Pseudolycoriella hygida]|uniref:Uncharacterized protein n=1 Tax=Pseudolycoriella hygida TaxID=35572 RepID=A0A9Q0S927_9DIPT|nr:hypothetical protein Bhyg_05078 [Pseudolycoriella hygida]
MCAIAIIGLKCNPFESKCALHQLNCMQNTFEINIKYVMSVFKPLTQKIRKSSRKIVKEIEKLKIYCSGGYKKIQPRVFGRAVLTMVHPSIIEAEVDNCKDHFPHSVRRLKKRETSNYSADIQQCSTSTACGSKQQKVELPEKEILTCQIVPCKNKAVDHVYDVRFQKITPCTKLALFRRQSTAPEFV